MVTLKSFIDRIYGGFRPPVEDEKMTTLYKSEGREMTPNNPDDDLLKHLEADGWSTKKPKEVKEVTVEDDVKEDDE